MNSKKHTLPEKGSTDLLALPLFHSYQIEEEVVRNQLICHRAVHQLFPIWKHKYEFIVKLSNAQGILFPLKYNANIVYRICHGRGCSHNYSEFWLSCIYHRLHLGEVVAFRYLPPSSMVYWNLIQLNEWNRRLKLQCIYFILSSITRRNIVNAMHT